MTESRVLDDPDVIERLYCDDEQSIREIADLHGCSHTTVANRMEEYDIDRRPRGKGQRKEPSTYVRSDGYVAVRYQRNGTRYEYLEHRPVLMRKYGWRKVVEEELQCHHIDGDKTNNDPSNLDAVTGEEHGRLHAENRMRAEDGTFLPMVESQSEKQEAEVAALD